MSPARSLWVAADIFVPVPRRLFADVVVLQRIVGDPGELVDDRPRRAGPRRQQAEPEAEVVAAGNPASAMVRGTFGAMPARCAVA